MQTLVDKVNTAADNTGEFGRIEDELIQSAKDKHYPLHFAYGRSGELGTATRGGVRDSQETAQFAIVGKAKNFSFAEIETLWESVVTNAISNRSIEIDNFDSFDAHFGSDRVRIALYEMSRDATRCF